MPDSHLTIDNDAYELLLDIESQFSRLVLGASLAIARAAGRESVTKSDVHEGFRVVMMECKLEVCNAQPDA